MIKLQNDNAMKRAIERAKARKPRVRCISPAERIYTVTSRTSDVIYIVKFAVANGLKLAECECKAGQAHQLCVHVVAAAAVNIALHSTYSRPSEAPKATAVSRAALIAEIETRWTRKHPKFPLGLALLKHFGTNQLNDLATGFLGQIRDALR